MYRKIGKVEHSLGKHSEDTEARYAAFHSAQDRNASRLSDLAEEMNTWAAILCGLGMGRLPLTAARVLREIRAHEKLSPLRMVGTNALCAYEALGSVRFKDGATATGDIDLLQDDRRRLRLLTEEIEPIGLSKLIQKRVGNSFELRCQNDLRLTNSKGYMVELIRPEPRPIYRSTPGANPTGADEISPAPDPKFWATHKIWLSRREDRDPWQIRPRPAPGAHAHRPAV
ncbi:GSU2403 family nucleotidyltransferase fold protein [Sulfitobacter sp. D35]|uniref:GSU2403 family nucleotidyltransferase fold protein n=1 Tax=Sulfitobacter sp. D35 TaxID=3083252 RepID=UPI00296FFE15|nr:GSU2403 family nucleotidyltransferase fold protein [Sulfitobacter sp. D35]MDW4499182.1 GSU2403 family nucleotidyltransferase fold protein [Sulfitobacter sp. D35]